MRTLVISALATLLLVSSNSAAQDTADSSVEQATPSVAEDSLVEDSVAEDVITAGQLGPTRELTNEELIEARSARDRADKLQAEFSERLYTIHREQTIAAARRGQPPRPESFVLPPEFEAEADMIVEAYQDPIDRYPHTEIAAYCALRLAGHYQQIGRSDESILLMAKTACEFAGTPEGINAIFDTGLAHLQGQHDPAEALKWFARIPKPTDTTTSRGGWNEGTSRYFSAQQQSIKCELQLGLDEQAQKRRDELKRTHAEQADEIDRAYEFELKARASASQTPSTDDSSGEAKLGAEYGVALDRFYKLLPPQSSASASGEQ